MTFNNTYTITVTEVATTPVDSVSLNPNSAFLTVGGAAVELTATVLPTTATDRTVKWSTTGGVTLYTDQDCTEGNEVGTEATEALTVYAKGISAGDATVTVTSNADSTKSASCAVTVITSYPLWVGGTQVTSANASNIDGNNKASYDTNTNTLTLNGYSYSGVGYKEGTTDEACSAIYYNADVPLTIQMSGANSITRTGKSDSHFGDSSYCGIHSTGYADLTITGSSGASLNVTCEGNGSSAIYATGATLTVQGVSLTTSTTADSGNPSISCSLVKVVQGASVTATGGWNGISAEVEISANSSVIAAGNNKAIAYTVKNAIAGTGWSDAAGTEGQADIAVSTEGQSLTYKKVQFPVATVAVTGVTLDPGSATVTLGGEAVKLTAAVAPDDATNQKVIWRVSGTDGEIALYSDQECSKPVTKDTETDVLTVYVKGVSASTGSGLKIDVDSADGSGIHASCYVTVTKESAVAATVTANNRTYDGTEKPLVTVTGEPTGGEMQYALGTETEATEQYTTSIPTATNAGTYYVWYKVKGNENHNDADPKVVTVKIATPSTYTVTVTNDGHGTGAANPASGATGTEVTLTNTPAEGYQFKEWQVISGGVTVADNKFTIGTANVEVKAIFEALPVYTVTVTNDGHGTGAANPASGVTGTEVTLTNTPAEGYQFKEWQVISGGVTVADNKFTIGTANVEIKAVFEALPEGSETGITQTVSGAPAITGSNMAEVVQSVVEAIQNGTLKDVPDNVKQAVSQPGAQVTLTLISKPLADSDVPAADKTALNEAVQANGYDGYQPFDLSLLLTVKNPATGETVQTEIHASSKEVTFTLDVPDSLKKEGRTFYLLHTANGTTNEVTSAQNPGPLSGSSTDFSTYAIAYRDAAEPVKSTFYFRKVWEGSTEKSIDFTLYSADGKVVHQSFTKEPGTAKEWSYYAVFTGAGNCYVIEKPIPGYITRYVNVGEYAGITDRCCNGGTIINKRIPKTGDETPLLLWAGMLLTGAAGLTVALTVNKRRKAHK